MKSTKNLNKFYTYFSKNDCISKERNLIEINLNFTQEASKIMGIISLITSSLNAEDINIVEIISSAPELILFLKKEDLLKALKVIDNLERLFKS